MAEELEATRYLTFVLDEEVFAVDVLGTRSPGDAKYHQGAAGSRVHAGSHQPAWPCGAGD